MSTLHDGFGAIRFPAPVVSEAVELDPGHESLLGLIQTAINSELGASWPGLVQSLKSDHCLVRDGKGTPVGYASPLEITPQQMTQFKASYPLLAVYRQGEPEDSEFGLNGLIVSKQEWSVDYILGPLHAGHIVKFGRFCIAVAAAIRVAILHGYHPDFRGGARQFFGEFSEVKFKSRQGPGLASAMTEESGSGYYGMTCTIETTERVVLDGYAEADTFETFTGYVPVGTGTADVLIEIINDVDFDNETPDTI